MNKQWPPSYTLRYSEKAKYLRLIMDKYGNLELVMPKRAKLSDAKTFIESRKTWVERHWELLGDVQAPPEAPTLPLTFNLHAMHEHWRIEYQAMPGSHYVRLLLDPDQHLLVLQGKTTDPQKCYIVLEKWLRNKAKDFLHDLLSSVSEEIKLPYSRFSLRGQKTRWGSCSRHKSISLNFRLIFLPYAVARNIVIHELCHTVHLDHSQKFWRLVAKYDPEVETAKKVLKQADHYLPKWLQI